MLLFHLVPQKGPSSEVKHPYQFWLMRVGSEWSSAPDILGVSVPQTLASEQAKKYMDMLICSIHPRSRRFWDVYSTRMSMIHVTGFG